MKKSALVCSGGGALGLAELGIVSVLVEEGYEFDYYAGVSAGSIICSLLAIGWTPDEIWKFVQKDKLFRLGIDPNSQNRFGLLRGRAFLSLCNDIFGKKKIEDLNLPLMIGTTDFQTGETVELTEGRVAEAVRASCGIPVIFPPFWHKHEKKWLVDGGLSCNFPLESTIQKYKGKHIIAIQTHNHLKEIDFSKKRIFGVSSLQKALTRTIRIMLKNQEDRQISDKRTLLFQPNLGEFAALSLKQATFEKLYQIGREYAQEKLKELKK